MKVYLAAHYDRFPLMRSWRYRLGLAGIGVTSRWIDGGHELGDFPTDDQRARLAREDLEDLDAADVVVLFNPAEDHWAGRGGRHVELGYAIGKGKPIVLVGERENVFHWLPAVTVTTQDEHAVIGAIWAAAQQKPRMVCQACIHYAQTDEGLKRIGEIVKGGGVVHLVRDLELEQRR